MAETEIVSRQYHEGLLRGLKIVQLYAEEGKTLTPDKLQYEIDTVNNFRIKEDLPPPKADEKRAEAREKTAETKELNLQLAQALDLSNKLAVSLNTLPLNIKPQIRSTINNGDIALLSNPGMSADDIKGYHK